MTESQAIEPKECPFLRPRMASHLGAFPIGVYCRLPSGRIRIPARDELTRFCTTGGYCDCLVYRRAHAWEISFMGLA